MSQCLRGGFGFSHFALIPCYLRSMTRAASFAGLILAAGDSSRMGRDKALLPWPPQETGRASSSDTFLSAAIHSLSLATEFVLVVVGKNEAALAPIIYADGASLVVNPDPGRGQFSSLQIGLHEVLNHGRDAVMVTLVDRPPAAPQPFKVCAMPSRPLIRISGRWFPSSPANTGIPTWWAAK